MMRCPIVAGNWKMHLGCVDEALVFVHRAGEPDSIIQCECMRAADSELGLTVVEITLADVESTQAAVEAAADEAVHT